MNRLKFSIYRRVDGRLHELFKISRTPTGLYFNPVHDPTKATMRTEGPVSPPYSWTYHEDGRSWDKRGARRGALRKTREMPLSSFSGSRTVSTLCSVGAGGCIFPLEASVTLRPVDIVVDRSAWFGVEIMLSDKVVTLDPLPERLNSTTYVKDEVFPIIIVEVFDLASPALVSSRFPRTEPLVEGKNLFFDHQQRI
jgi:hypothetical protein